MIGLIFPYHQQKAENCALSLLKMHLLITFFPVPNSENPDNKLFMRIVGSTIGARTFVQDWVAMEDYLKQECQDLNFTVFKLPWVGNWPYKEGTYYILSRAREVGSPVNSSHGRADQTNQPFSPSSVLKGLTRWITF